MNAQQLFHERVEAPWFNRHPNRWFLPTALKVYEYEELTRPLLKRSPGSLLDLGSGIGLQSLLLAAAGWSVTGVDPDASRVAKARARAATVRTRRGSAVFFDSTIEQAPLESACFDAAISFCVLEHIPDLDSCLQEVHRVLKPHGEFHVTVDCLANVDDQALLERHSQDYAVHRLFVAHSAPEYFEERGFEVHECRAIMKGDHAIERLRAGWLPQRESLVEKRSHVRALRREDASTQTDAGLMLLLRMSKRSDDADEPRHR
jgi:SAM-dependent methyltransferase